MFNFEEFRNYLKSIFKSGSFVQNVSIVFSGNVLNFLIQFGSTPIISRIFGPEAYGEYAYYNLIITNILFVGGMSLPEVYLIPRERYKFLALGKFVVSSVVLITLISLIFYTLFRDLMDTPIPLVFITIITIRLIIGPINAVLGSINSRRKKFSKNVFIHISGTVLAKSSVIIAGLYGLVSGLGLLLGDLLRSIYSVGLQVELKNAIIFFRYLFKNNWKEVWNTLKEYKGVVYYLFPSQVLNKWTGDLVILGIGLIYSETVLGLYVFAATILNIPITLIENSIRPVLFQKAVEVSQTNSGDLGYYYLKTLRIVPILSGGLIFILSGFANLIFPFVFGDKWASAGMIVPLMSIQYFASALIAPYDSFWRILKKEKELLRNNIISLLFRYSPLIFIFFHLSEHLFIVLISIGSFLGSMFMHYKLSKLLLKPTTSRNVIISSIFFVMLASTLSYLLSLAIVL